MKDLGYNDELQKSAQEAAPLNEFWQEVADKLDELQEQDKALVEPRQAPKKK